MATYPLKFKLPHTGLVWLEWYEKHKVFHPGYDLNSAPGDQDLGDPVVCPVNGNVEYVSPEPKKLNGQNGGFGWFVIVYHSAWGVWTRYAHLDKVVVIQGQKLKEGDRIGDLGKSGTSYAHLHWEVWKSELFKIQANHWRKFAYYPSGKTKAWVNDHYIDGLQWITDLNKKPQWREEAEVWAGKYIKDLPGFLGEYDPHKHIELIRRAVSDKNNL